MTMRLEKLTRTVFTKYAEPKPVREKTWYGIIDANGKSLKVEMITRFRSEAVEYFKGQAKLHKGVLTTVRAY